MPRIVAWIIRLVACAAAGLAVYLAWRAGYEKGLLFMAAVGSIPAMIVWPLTARDAGEPGSEPGPTLYLGPADAGASSTYSAATSLNGATRRHRRWLALVSVVLLAILGYAARPYLFIAFNAARFVVITDRAEARSLKDSEGVYFRQFASGEWVVSTSECSCGGGGGFDSMVLRDSHGHYFWNATYHFCGIEGLYGELNAIDARALDDFYLGLEKLVGGPT